MHNFAKGFLFWMDKLMTHLNSTNLGIHDLSVETIPTKFDVSSFYTEFRALKTVGPSRLSKHQAHGD